MPEASPPPCGMTPRRDQPARRRTAREKAGGLCGEVADGMPGRDCVEAAGEDRRSGRFRHRVGVAELVVQIAALLAGVAWRTTPSASRRSRHRRRGRDRGCPPIGAWTIRWTRPRVCARTSANEQRRARHAAKYASTRRAEARLETLTRRSLARPVPSRSRLTPGTCRAVSQRSSTRLSWIAYRDRGLTHESSLPVGRRVSPRRPAR